MKYKALTALIGAALVMTCVSGCGHKESKEETELGSVVISDIEVVGETEEDTSAEADTESESEAESESDSEQVLEELDVNVASKDGTVTDTNVTASNDKMLVEGESESETEADTEAEAVFVDKTGEEVTEETYPPFIENKWYYNGDKCSENGSNYTCIAPDGVACVWSPSAYPAYWKLDE